MAYLAGLTHKNLFSYSRIVTTMSTLNRSEIFYTPPSTGISAFMPYYATLKHISGTISTGLIMTLGTVANTYNNIASITYPTTVNGYGRDECSDSLIVSRGTSIYMKNTTASTDSTNLVFELTLYGYYFTAY